MNDPEKQPLNKVIVTVLDGLGMPKQVTVEVPATATREEIEEAIEKAKRNE